MNKMFLKLIIGVLICSCSVSHAFSMAQQTPQFRRSSQFEGIETEQNLFFNQSIEEKIKTNPEIAISKIRRKWWNLLLEKGDIHYYAIYSLTSFAFIEGTFLQNQAIAGSSFVLVFAYLLLLNFLTDDELSTEERKGLSQAIQMIKNGENNFGSLTEKSKNTLAEIFLDYIDLHAKQKSMCETCVFLNRNAEPGDLRCFENARSADSAFNAPWLPPVPCNDSSYEPVQLKPKISLVQKLKRVLIRFSTQKR